MSTPERAFELIKTIAGDDALRARLTEASISDSERQAIIADLGFGDVQAEDIAAASAQLALQSNDELSDQELESIAGGADTITTTTTTTTVTTAASAAVAT